MKQPLMPKRRHSIQPYITQQHHIAPIIIFLLWLQFTMTNFNPMHLIQHAWNGTHSHWGKTCVVLFYLFLWFQILGSIAAVIAPTMGMECYLTGLSPYAAAWIMVNSRIMGVLALVFTFYVYREGIKVWNVAIVFLVNSTLTWIALTSPMMDLEDTPSCADKDMMKTMCWIQVWWTVLFLLCSVLEERSSNKPSGTLSERTPIV